MAGQNLWHKPYYQPQLSRESTTNSSKDKFEYQLSYHKHQQRLQKINQKPVKKLKLRKQEIPKKKAPQIHKINKQKTLQDDLKLFNTSSEHNVDLIGGNNETMYLQSPPQSPQSSRIHLNNTDIFGKESSILFNRSTSFSRNRRPTQIGSTYGNQSFSVMRKISIGKPKQQSFWKGVSFSVQHTK